MARAIMSGSFPGFNMERSFGGAASISRTARQAGVMALRRPIETHTLPEIPSETRHRKVVDLTLPDDIETLRVTPEHELTDTARYLGDVALEEVELQDA